MNLMSLKMRAFVLYNSCKSILNDVSFNLNPIQCIILSTSQSILNYQVLIILIAESLLFMKLYYYTLVHQVNACPLKAKAVSRILNCFLVALANMFYMTHNFTRGSGMVRPINLV